MFLSTVIMGLICFVALVFAYSRGKHIEGLMAAKDLTISILPLLIFAFIISGLIQVLIPAKTISGIIGEQSGAKGIFIGAIAGGLLPGGPYVSLPIIVGLSRAGASIPVLVAMLTGWSLIAVARLPMEFGMLGPKLALIRLASVIIFAPMAGFTAKLLVKIFNL